MAGKDPKQNGGAKKAPKKLPQSKRSAWSIIVWILVMVVWVGAVVVAAQFFVGYLMFLMLGAEKFSEPVSTAVMLAISDALAIVIIVFLTPRMTGIWRSRHKGSKRQKVPVMSRKELGLKELPTWTDIGLTPVGYVVYLVLAGILLSLFNTFPWFNVGQAQDVGFSPYLTGGDRVVAFIALVIIAPIAEEVIFRGWLYGKLRGRLSHEISEFWSIAIASLVVSTLFGAVHMQWNVGVNVFALSIVLCALHEVTGTIYAGILLHMLKNGIAFYLLYVFV